MRTCLCCLTNSYAFVWLLLLLLLPAACCSLSLSLIRGTSYDVPRGAAAGLVGGKHFALGWQPHIQDESCVCTHTPSCIINKINKTIIDDVDYIIALSYQGNPDAGLMASDKIYNTINGGDFFIKNLSYSDIVIFKNKKLTE